MNITIDKAVLEQALEALNHGITEMNHRGCAIECMSLHHATKAIREALAQPQPVQQCALCPECDGTGTVAGSQAHFPCPLCTSPQAAQPLSDVGKDAARYRWLRSTTNYVTSNGNKIDVRNQPELWDSTIDAAIEAAHSITKGTT